MKITIKREQKQTGLILPSVSNLHNAVAKTKFLSVLAVTAILFASCSSDDEATTEVNDGRVLFSSGVNAATPKVGGADGDEWTLNDPIGIYMRDNAAGKAIVSENIKYSATTLSNGDKNATFTSATPIYYPVNTPEKVDFVAYYPYSQNTNHYNNVYKVDLTKQTTQSNIDLMIAANDNSGTGYDKTNTVPVDLVFDHQLVKVIINVTAGNSVPNLSGLAAKIKGMNTTADFDIQNRTLSNEDTPSDIAPYNVPNTSTFEAILLPVATLGDNHIVEFKVWGSTYKWTIKDNSTSIDSFVGAKKYTFTVTLNKTTVDVTGNISKWDPVGAATGTAN